MSMFLNFFIGACLGFSYASQKSSPLFVGLMLLIILATGAIIRPLMTRHREESWWVRSLDGAFDQIPLMSFTWFSYVICMLLLHR